MDSDDAAATLRSRLVAALRERLVAEDPDAAGDLRAGYRALAQDYRTFRLMDELPAHADGAHSAWRDLVPELSDAVSRRQLLELLEAAYLEAIETRPAAERGDQDGQ